MEPTKKNDLSTAFLMLLLLAALLVIATLWVRVSDLREEKELLAQRYMLLHAVSEDVLRLSADLVDENRQSREFYEARLAGYRFLANQAKTVSCVPLANTVAGFAP